MMRGLYYLRYTTLPIYISTLPVFDSFIFAF